MPMLLLHTNSFRPFLLSFKQGMSEAAWSTSVAPQIPISIPYFLLLDHFKILMGGRKKLRSVPGRKASKCVERIHSVLLII